ncbi:MAG: GGDEF domain-containing protein [Maricaulaceae bacterium]|nr:GGDEF domain-containing protein [Maricaulaceae bacterium]
MERHGIAPTPQNYALWVCFVSDSIPELCEAIQKHIDEALAFDEPFLDGLYERFFHLKHIQDAVMASSGDMNAELIAVRESLQAAEAQTAAYGQTLAGATGELGKAADPVALKRMVETLADATAKMQQRGRDLERRLHETSREVTQLRSNLERVREEAMTDALTGVANRKRFDEALRKAKRGAEIQNEDFCLVLCDIDHFKRFNDTWGHQTGDQIIRFVASCLTRHAAEHHVVARYGGEEFGIVMPRTRLAEAADIAEKARQTVQSKRLLRKSTNEDLGNITISLGVSQHRDSEAVESLIQRSDTNLYKSKQDGRNRVTVDAGTGAVRSAA